MEASDEALLNYTLEGFHHYTRENDMIGPRRSTIFEMVLTVDGTAMRHEASFNDLLEACEKHDPPVFAFIKRLEEDIDASHLDYPELVEALETEGFDFEQLVRCYLDHIPARSFYPEGSPPPELLETAADTAAFLKTMDWDEFRSGMLALQNAIEYLDLDKKMFKMAKRLMNKAFVRLNEFSKTRLKEFYHKVDLDTGYLAWQLFVFRLLVLGDEKVLEVWEEELKNQEPAAKQAAIIARRGAKEEYAHEFSLEVVGMESWWEVTGDNRMYIYVHVVAAEGDAHLDVAFRDIKEEACLYDRVLYERILALESSIEAVLPKEGEVLEALLAEGWDLVPLLHSYCKVYGDIASHILWKRLAEKGGYAPRGEYYEYLNGREDMNDDYCKWSHTCHIVETKLVKLYMALLQKEYPELLEAPDWRVTDRAVSELKVICSNLMYDIKHDFSELHVGGVVWPELAAGTAGASDT